MSRWLCRLLVVALAMASSTCGYALAGRGSFLPTDIRVVGIPQLVNRTTFFDVEQILTEKIRNEFIGRGKYRVVPEATGDSVMEVISALSTASAPAVSGTTRYLPRPMNSLRIFSVRICSTSKKVVRLTS